MKIVQYFLNKLFRNNSSECYVSDMLYKVSMSQSSKSIYDTLFSFNVMEKGVNSGRDNICPSYKHFIQLKMSICVGGTRED